ncbi:MAG: TetR/AcrR family transcriptional regulator [Anaeromicrobium sp.]|jgi:AcrR family transcriptional regulator|uniref:TetR/AcrR family transcriptional regulator n=1 Tax=Anaeromicrobium sp. TaxID=1929132 RepID=UPI0025D7AB10|nr:TetR/AcrR family transcriptional regulator [Anaeromicrobium sp.]MCT4594447.1 TetR/AcrR family transcriptional regulator [Anaeromicrobium sp.]
MARKADPTKIEKIKEAAVEMIVEYGYIGASIAQIAKRAGVSTGYMYRHYESKEELVAELIRSNFEIYKDKINSLGKREDSIYDIVEDFVRELFIMAKEKPSKAMLAAVLALESGTTFQRIIENNADMISKFIETIVVKGKKRKELGEQMDSIDMGLVLLVMPLTYISWILRDDMDTNKLTEERIDKIVKMCVNALK